MIHQVMHYLRQYHMISEHDHVIAGVSGGADSVCLFLILNELQEKLGFTMSVVHVEHGIRGEESLKDAEFVRSLAGQFHIPCTILSYSVPGLAREQGLSLEEAARKVRYEAFDQETRRIWSEKSGQMAQRDGDVKIAVAHHMEDQAETMIFHLCRGSGIDGLGGMRPVQGRIIRPLLWVSRQEIEEYLRKKGQAFCIDSTNSDTDYSRNFIRHEIIPGLCQINSRSIPHMREASEELWEISFYLEEQARQALEESMKRQQDGTLYIDVELLKKQPDVIMSRVLKKALEQAAGCGRDISRKHVKALMDLAGGQVGRKISLPYRLLAERTYTGLVILQNYKEMGLREGTLPKEKDVPRETSRIFGALDENAASLPKGQKITVPGGMICLEIWEKNKKDINFPKKKCTKWIDYDKIKTCLLFRTRETGDYFTIDHKEHRKKLKSYFINEKVPADCRDKIILAADGSHIVWALGYRISEHYKVTDNTRRILEIRWMEEEE